MLSFEVSVRHLSEVAKKQSGICGLRAQREKDLEAWG